MKSVIILPQLQVQNANAISGLTYGFPAISHFLGFGHALSRKLQARFGLKLGGCAVIAHHHQLQSQPLGRQHAQVFALTRNPLTKEGNTAPINEEGRMHLTISLVIECLFDGEQLTQALQQHWQLSVQQLQQWLMDTVPTMRIAGGTVLGLHPARYQAQLDPQQERKLRLSLLPGFALVSCHAALQQHHQQQQAQQPQQQLLDSWLDFCSLKMQSPPNDAQPSAWQVIPKPASGYLVPIMVGYQAISEVFEAGSIPSSRDANTPFVQVEAIHSIGKWVSPHRVELSQLMWHHHQQANQYLCINHYQSTPNNDAEPQPSAEHESLFIDDLY